MNKHDVGGVIKSDVSLRHTKSNKPVVNMLIQSSDSYRDSETGKTLVSKNMHNVKFWGPLALMVTKHYQKGDYIIVSGRSETKKHRGGYMTELIVKEVENINR